LENPALSRCVASGRRFFPCLAPLLLLETQRTGHRSGWSNGGERPLDQLLGKRLRELDHPDVLAEGRGCQSSGWLYFLPRFVTFPSRRNLHRVPRGNAGVYCHSAPLPAGGSPLMISLRYALIATLVALAPTSAFSQAKGQPKGQPRKGPEPPATDPATMKVMKGFKVELLYSVPINEQGSWVSMCVDPKGRLIVSDQYGSLYRVTPPPVGKTDGTTVEKIPAKIGSAQGLLWAFDALYVVVNGPGSGLYKVTSSKNDDTLDKVELLRTFEGGGGEHGPHAVLLNPDGKRITV